MKFFSESNLSGMSYDKAPTKEFREKIAGEGGLIMSCQAHHRSQHLTKGTPP